jgi:hypothetical protein
MTVLPRLRNLVGLSAKILEQDPENPALVILPLKPCIKYRDFGAGIW